MFGEVFLCRFPFTSGRLSKPRPALVLFDAGQDVVLCRITSAQARGPRDVTVADWRGAGLLKPSIVRLDRLVTAERSTLWRRLGRLTSSDAAAIRTAWNQQMRL